MKIIYIALILIITNSFIIKKKNLNFKINGYYYSIEKYNNCPVDINKNKQINEYHLAISPMVFYSSGSLISFNSFVANKKNIEFNCSHRVNNTIESALRNFECYIFNQSIEQINREFKDSDYFGHGKFSSDNNKIKTQILDLNNEVGIELIEQQIEILNDTTLVLTKRKNTKNEQFINYEPEIKLHFKKFDEIPLLKNVLLN